MAVAVDSGTDQEALAQSVTVLRGVGAALAERLAALDIATVGDLLFHMPLRYEDRTRLQPVDALTHNLTAQLALRIDDAQERLAGRRQMVVHASDAGGAPLRLRFFHFRRAQLQSLRRGAGLRVWGTARLAPGGWEMVHPEYRLFPELAAVRAEGGIHPVYPLTAGVTQARLRDLIDRALAAAADSTVLAAEVPGLHAPSTLAALRIVHRPDSAGDVALLMDRRHPAQLRLVDEELLAHHLGLRMIRQRKRSVPAPPITDFDAAVDTLVPRLGFAPTGAQRRVINEIAGDCGHPAPMLRLVQGDVGSGKTVVAAAAMLAAARAGWQSALMAPTELLAEQHARTLSGWLAPLQVDVRLLTGRQKAAERRVHAEALATGQAMVAVGTHAIFQEQTRFHRLGLVVIDEQHRFGVRQRLALRDKSSGALRPHQLVMTATPIPRTLAQTVYADLDVSVIDEMPPGRTPVVTAAVANSRRDEVIERLRTAVAEGRQAYWVCTLIEESEQLDAQAAEDTAELLRQSLPGVAVGLAHGRMKATDKQAVMEGFQAGRVQILVATTVVEVGVDVPNASIMVIDNAERLGLSQLHQLRGRVGRGHARSQCLLMYQPPLGDTARERLDVMRRTHSGFEIAQKDLELRGPGELLGRRQTGLVGLRIADPARDAARVPELLRLADTLLTRDAALAQQLVRRWVGDVQQYGNV